MADLVLCDSDGDEAVRVNTDTAQVTIREGITLDEASQAFWDFVQRRLTKANMQENL